jgi:hypothetical protein
MLAGQIASSLATSIVPSDRRANVVVGDNAAARMLYRRTPSLRPRSALFATPGPHCSVRHRAAFDAVSTNNIGHSDRGKN